MSFDFQNKQIFIYVFLTETFLGYKSILEIHIRKKLSLFANLFF